MIQINMLLAVFTLIHLLPQHVQAQEVTPKGAFLRSAAMPGWGHFYAGKDNRNRGNVHLAADVLLIGGLIGSVFQEKHLEEKYHTLAALQAGVHTKNRSRAFQLAVGGYPSLGEYNDYQLRSRNWDRLFPDELRNNWNWQNEDARQRYNGLRSRRDNAKNRVPMLLGGMVVNRVVSAISAYNRAKNNNYLPEISVSPVYGANHTAGGYVATVRFTY